MIRKGFIWIVLSASTACWGCCACDHVDDYTGTYQGGVIGDWDGHMGRAGSAYVGAAAAGEVHEVHSQSESATPRSR